MDFPAAIDLQKSALLRIIATLFAMLDEAEARGITLPPEAWRALAARVASASRDWRPPDTARGDMPPANRESLAERYAAAGETAVRPALARLRARLLLAANRSPQAYAWDDLPRGDLWYQWRLQSATGAARTPAEWNALARS